MLKHNLIVDDLIIEYMIYKVKNGYEPEYLVSEFIQFFHFFKNKMSVSNVTFENEKLFQRFFKKKEKLYGEGWYQSHIKMEYSLNDSDYMIKAGYKLSDFDRSIINTYSMDDKKVSKIKNIIGEFLSSQPKRMIDESIEVDKNDLLIGKYSAAEIMAQIWYSYINNLIESQLWPQQCKDICKYLLKIDLAKMIDVSSIKDELIRLYYTFSKRISILYHQDRNLKVSSNPSGYLARANYELLIQDFEKLLGIAVGPYQKSLEFDLSLFTFEEKHVISNVSDYDDESEIKTTTIPIKNDEVKRLVKNLENTNYKY